MKKGLSSLIIHVDTQYQYCDGVKHFVNALDLLISLCDIQGLPGAEAGPEALYQGMALAMP
jgi:hypothetical protein